MGSKEMVPVLNKNKKQLMPCTEKRARLLLERGDAKAFWKQGIFCIILTKDPSDAKNQEVVVGIDPGSKRTGVTVVTNKSVVLNILIDTPHWIKDKIQNRSSCRRNRRSRQTPYRKCRINRGIGGMPPSTKARWQAHIRVINVLQSILPVSDIVIEDIKAESRKGCYKWNKSFSPLEIGKQWFESQISVKLYKFEGFKTKEHRDIREFNKINKKLDDRWEAHNVDSHSLCEMVIGNVNPFKGILRCYLLNFYRRQLHVQNYAKGGVRKKYGGTISLGIKRGTLVTHPKYGKCFVGGTSKGEISLHSVVDGRRLTQNAMKDDLKTLSRLKWRSAFLPALKGKIPSRK